MSHLIQGNVISTKSSIVIWVILEAYHASFLNCTHGHGPSVRTIDRDDISLVDTKQLLQTYKDKGAIDGYFQVDTTRSDEYNYLLWSDSDEEVVLQVQGVLLEGHVPPVVGSGTIEAIHYFMSRFDKKPSTYYPMWIDNMDAICAATHLLTPTQHAKSDVVDHGAVDDNDVLRNVFHHGSHCYTEDNVVAFLKWDKKVDGSM
ncbi:hypothetical protein IW261DRAFT_1423926 [Armillaria novae-zelandiae]|uniref:Uncharacterized protein n=1 Tax=Armillaria novae-zelandiae TaxID=153914 RepID=A0AA39T944_9AGAR|nr:hypothetical protein IW261DRAFT_1423926 [Armillaria novae-zelandiae]